MLDGLSVSLFDDVYFVISGRPRSVRYLAKNLSKVLGCIERLEKETYLLLLGIAQICRHA